MFAAIKMRLETDPVLVDFTQSSQTEHLKAAAVGENRTIPVHEFMQATEASHPLMTRTQVKVIGVAQDNLRADLLKLLRHHPFDRTLSTHRHEGRCFNSASTRMNSSATSPGLRALF